MQDEDPEAKNHKELHEELSATLDGRQRAHTRHCHHKKHVELHEELSATLDGWQRAHSDIDITRSMLTFPDFHSEAIVQLFIKYNTLLAMQFCTAGDMHSEPKRSDLSAANFQKLDFVRGNMNFIKL